ncbi:thiamine pyrophosphate-binding protein [Shewanella sp.]|uniref:thiamine pyrophosphate-binding protein n=1 Tax=Shewanella sp. TaxID=50422 RepID=UPI003566FAB7
MNAISQNLGIPYSEQLPTLGQSLCEVLQFFGLNRIYGVGGDFVANLINALDPSISVLPSSNEMHAGFTACAQAELSGLGACLTTYTVGSLPCVSAAALARTEGLPVIFLSGAPGESEIHGQALHHMVHPGCGWHTDLNAALNAFKALGIKAERLQGQRHQGQPNVAAARFFELVSEALQTRQPVYIEVPRDLVNLPTQKLRLPTSLAELTAYTRLGLEGAELIAADISERLKRATFPMLYLGERLRMNRPLLKRILDFCHRLGLPYATSWFAKGMVDESHPLCLGAYNGVFSACRGQAYVEGKADFVLELGTAIYDSDTNNAFASGTHAIDTHSNKTLLKGTARCELDLLAVMDELERTELPVRNIPLGLNESGGEKNNSTNDMSLSYANLATVINAFQRHAGQDLVIVPEVGNALFAAFALEARSSVTGRSFLANPWYAAMGTSLPYARAIADELNAQESDQPILLITGDGGFNFQCNELINLQKQNANLIILYMRNNIFHLGKAGDAPIYHCNDHNFSPAKLVEAYGGKYHYCDKTNSLADLLQICCQGGLHLIEIPTSTHNECLSPIAIKLNTYIGFKNGLAEATEAWHQLCGMNQCNAESI